MTANELADAVKSIYIENPLAPTEFLMAIEATLRGQQAEIEALKEFKRQYETLNRNVINDLMLAKSEIEALKEKIKWLEGRELFKNE